jgi:hypothetical protein
MERPKSPATKLDIYFSFQELSVFLAQLPPMNDCLINPTYLEWRWPITFKTLIDS